MMCDFLSSDFTTSEKASIASTILSRVCYCVVFLFLLFFFFFPFLHVTEKSYSDKLDYVTYLPFRERDYTYLKFFSQPIIKKNIYIKLTK